MAIKALSAPSSGWDRDARKAERSKGRDLSGEGRQGRKMDVGSRDEAMTAPLVQIAKQGAEARDWSWVEGSVWTDRMLSALGNGVKGGVWYSLMDKVYAPATLAAAWAKVQVNGGAAGVDR